jgi:hypothetical protein
MAKLGEVFRLSGEPTYTFVEPLKYHDIKVSLDTPGRCLVLEGPSGIGKTTTIRKAAAEIGADANIKILNARVPREAAEIATLIDQEAFGTIIVDDFHRLEEPVKDSLANKMKVLADAGNDHSKLVLIGINKAGQQLVKFARDLGSRMDLYKLESNPEEKLLELVSSGEQALNVSIRAKEQIAKAAQGSFQIAQLLSHRACTLSKVTETENMLTRPIDVSFDVVTENVMESLSREFDEVAKIFARGPKLRREGRAPYLRLLRWLSESDEWALDIRDKIKTTPEHGESVGQVISKKYLDAFMAGEHSKLLESHFTYDAEGEILSVEDPRLVFYLKNLNWRAFVRRCGYTLDYFPWKYDFALSFSGQDRTLAKSIFDALTERQISAFYDFDHVDRMLANDIEEYLAPIYRSEARFVVPLLSASYPTRIWTKFESDQFKDRFGEKSVIPISFTNIPGNLFSPDQKVGGLSFNPDEVFKEQISLIVESLAAKLLRDKQNSPPQE